MLMDTNHQTKCNEKHINVFHFTMIFIIIFLFLVILPVLVDPGVKTLFCKIRKSVNVVFLDVGTMMTILKC